MFAKITIGITLVVLGLSSWLLHQFQECKQTKWLTYASPKYSFSIQYPPSWKVEQIDEGQNAQWLQIVPSDNCEKVGDHPIVIMLNPPVDSALDTEDFVMQELKRAPEGLVIKPKIWHEEINKKDWVFLLDEESDEPYNSLIAYTKHDGKIYDVRIVPYHTHNLSLEMIKAREIFESMLHRFVFNN